MAALVTARLEMSPQLTTALRSLGENAPNALGAALYQEAEDIMAKSKPLVPVDTGALRASGQVQTPRVSGNAVSVTLGYGNSSVAYALIVHENLSAHHDVGQAKYLEQPFLEATQGLTDRVTQRLNTLWVL